MKFCTQCENMYYISIDSENPNSLIYYCRNCQHKDVMISEEGVCVLDMNLKKGEQKFNLIVNEYTKLDPTLPRIYTMLCPNVECKTNTGASGSASVPSAGASAGGAGAEKKTEIIYLRYDANNLKYLYICSECNTTWKTDEKN